MSSLTWTLTATATETHDKSIRDSLRQSRSILRGTSRVWPRVLVDGTPIVAVAVNVHDHGEHQA